MAKDKFTEVRPIDKPSKYGKFIYGISCGQNSPVDVLFALQGRFDPGDFFYNGRNQFMFRTEEDRLAAILILS